MFKSRALKGYSPFFSRIEPYEGHKKLILNFTRHEYSILKEKPHLTVLNLPFDMKSINEDNFHEFFSLYIKNEMLENGIQKDLSPYILVPKAVYFVLPLRDIVSMYFGKHYVGVIKIDRNPDSDIYSEIFWYNPSSLIESTKNQRLIGKKTLAEHNNY
jgi:hypothetical protein